MAKQIELTDDQGAAIERLRAFEEALRGVGKPGDGTCESCGRSGIQTWRRSTVRKTDDGWDRRQVDLCAPCLAEANESLRSR